jgi:hypothetical protein
VSWQNRIPDGVGDVEPDDDGFTAKLSLPTDEDGFFGRACPACESPFKMHVAEYKALPEEVELHCPYCGHRDEHSQFMTPAQRERAMAALHGLAEQYVHDLIGDIFPRTFGSGSRPRSRNSMVSVEIRYTPGTPPPIRALPEIVEEQTRRVITCSSCTNRHAVYSAATFCPVCGLRPTTDTVLERIQTAREVLAMEDRVDADERETLRAAGVFERFAVDVLKSVASVFETFAREQFRQRVPNADQLTRHSGNVFQRLDPTAALFAEHAGVDLIAIAGEDRWQDLKVAFARRHVLTHCDAIADERFLAQVPSSPLKVGQRLVIRRADAEAALDDLDALVRGLAAI